MEPAPVKNSGSIQRKSRCVQKNLAFRLGAEIQVWTLQVGDHQSQSHCPHLTQHHLLPCSAFLPCTLAVPSVSVGTGGSLYQVQVYFPPRTFTQVLPPLWAHALPPSTLGLFTLLVTTWHCCPSPLPRHTSWAPVPRPEPGTQQAFSKLLGERVNG